MIENLCIHCGLALRKRTTSGYHSTCTLHYTPLAAFEGLRRFTMSMGYASAHRDVDQGHVATFVSVLEFVVRAAYL